MMCPCHSAKDYALCCQRYHLGQPVDNALLLMRSRYSAYALGNAQYIIDTTHPKNPNYKTNKIQWTKEILNFAKNTHFDNLEILDFTDGPTTAYVTFYAHLSQNGHNASFKEKSYFEKVEGRWLYHSGQILEGAKS